MATYRCLYCKKAGKEFIASRAEMRKHARKEHKCDGVATLRRAAAYQGRKTALRRMVEGKHDAQKSDITNSMERV